MKKPLLCAFGRPIPDLTWTGEDHCAQCHASMLDAIREFWEDVKAGKFNAQGYTRSEWIRSGRSKDTWASAPRRSRERAA